MELRVDRLLAELRDRPEAILAAIDGDPLLLKRTSGDLVLANASQTLYTPQEQHQLYAKGIIYTRNPYRLVSLPLLKIYNVGEREVTPMDLTKLCAEEGLRLRYLRKMDGTLIQVFRHAGRVWVTTRGMIEGGRWRFDESNEDRTPDFDYLATSRALLEKLYPAIFTDPELLERRTLLFELIHPQSRQVTNYGDLCDLIFLACFDHERCIYLAYESLQAVAERGNLRIVDMLTPAGDDLATQLENVIALFAGTDEEGSVICLERGDEVVYRAKIKSPEYLRLLRLLAFCTYDRSVEVIDAHPEWKTGSEMEEWLKNQGREDVPEEILDEYRKHWERFQAYLGKLDQLRSWGVATVAQLERELGGRAGRPPADFRKAFAQLAKERPNAKLLFAALDGKTDVSRLRIMFSNDEEADEALLGAKPLPGQSDSVH
jgi:hypothetical protein